MQKFPLLVGRLRSLCLSFAMLGLAFGSYASSHREAPLISNDPLADNTAVYAFKSPDDPNTITIIANYIPAQLPHGGPNYYGFGENVRYEIHMDNNAAHMSRINGNGNGNVNGNGSILTGDDIIYRFTFSTPNDDPTTFFTIRLSKKHTQIT